MPSDERAWVDPGDREIDASAERVLAFDGEVGPAATSAFGPSVERVVWITRPDQLAEPKLVFVLTHWQALAATRGGVPDRRDIDIVDLVPVMTNLMMLDVERDGFDAVYRVYGTAVVNRAARDWTGFRVSEMNRTTRTPVALMYRACYRAVFRRPAPLYTEHLSPPYLDVRSWRRLILPLADGDQPCGRFLVCNVPIGRRALLDDDLEELQRRIQRPLSPIYPGVG